MADEIVVDGKYVVPKTLYYTETDEWVKFENGLAVVGVTDYAQKQLRDIVGVELPDPGTNVSKGEIVGSIESVKTIADIYAPLTGEVVEVNERLYDEPELINKDPYGEGWLFKIKYSNPGEKDELLSPEKYAEKIASKH